MTIQFSTAVRNATLDAIETTISTAPTLTIRTGAAPADCATADSGTVLATLVLPSDWMSAGAAGVKSKLGTWEDTSADAAGTAAHYRIKQGATCHMQGSITSVATGTGDMLLDNDVLALGQAVTINTFTITASGA